MNQRAPRLARAVSSFDALQAAIDIIRQEARALDRLASRLDTSFIKALDYIVNCSGCVVVTGMGKAGLVGQKITATFASMGTPSHFVHPAEALHGDLGRIRDNDVVLALSYSGETDEVARMARAVIARGVCLIAVTGRTNSTLAHVARITLDLGSISEAGALQLAPSNSSTTMLALGDALALVASQQRGFTAEQFAGFHPGGSLGQLLDPVERHMRPLRQCRLSCDQATPRAVLVQGGQPGRRTGAVMLTSDDGRLTGIFTDSDLARLVERRRDQALDRPICEVMTRKPMVVEQGTLLRDAMRIMVSKKLSELPVIDGQHCPVGILDITDVMGLLPADLADETLRADEHSPENDVLESEAPYTVPFPATNRVPQR